MKSFFLSVLIALSFSVFAQNASDQVQIEATLNGYIDGFYKGDASKLKEVLKPRLYKFGYLKNKETGNYDYYQHMSFDQAIAFVEKMKKEGTTRDEDVIRSVEVLDIENHIASAKVTAAWGVDFVLLSKDNNKWMIEQVIWEGPYQKNSKADELTTTYYLIRHAEKDKTDKTNRNPQLTPEGLTRAKNWATIFKNVKFDAVYSTNYYRTVETAAPSAESNQVEIQFYNPSDFKIDEFKAKTAGKTVLIVGHSNTTPMFTNALLGNKTYGMIDENENGSLFIVTVGPKETTSQLLVIN